MTLSIIIVNYNTQYFILLCLQSVFKAIEAIDAEVIVVDNHSQDNSCSIISKAFPQVRLICNQQNTGFSKANNKGISVANGEYILLLNPDTILPEDCFEKALNFLQNNTAVGALGVKMIDGSGIFLPESKRGLPTPLTAFYKMSGMYRLFPHSVKIGAYYQVQLNENKTGEVEILTGAFFLARKKIGDALGWLDESYFMYGEDIDLSYSFTRAGSTIVYFADTAIVHFKGESSKQVDNAYVRNFFEAMELFYEKNFKKGYNVYVKLLVKIAIKLKSILVRVQQYLNLQKESKLPFKNTAIILLANCSETINAAKKLIKTAPIHVYNNLEQLNEIKSNETYAIIFTSDFSNKLKIKWMMKLAEKRNKVQFFFMSAQGDFIISSGSKKNKGWIIK